MLRISNTVTGPSRSLTPNIVCAPASPSSAPQPRRHVARAAAASVLSRPAINTDWTRTDSASIDSADVGISWAFDEDDGAPDNQYKVSYSEATSAVDELRCLTSELMDQLEELEQASKALDADAAAVSCCT